MKTKKSLRHLLFLFTVLSLLLSLCSCSVLALLSDMNGFDPEAYLKGNIDSVYLNIHDDDYLEMIESDKETVEQEYREGLVISGDAFSYYWGIYDESLGESYTDLSADLRLEIEDLMDKIYSHTKYEIVSVEKSGDKYIAELLVSPIDIMEKAINIYDSGTFEPLNTLFEKYQNADFSAMSDSEYAQFTNEYGHAIVDLVESQLPNIGYKEAKSLVIRIENVDDYYTINNEDWSTFDSYVIYLP